MEINLPMNPPVNNNIQGNTYDKLDAVTFEKVRVANALLESRRTLQERVINRYRKDAERVHLNQTQRLKREYKKIRTKKPDYVFDESDVTARSRDRSTEVGRQRSLSDVSNCSFCRRYYSHHFNIRDPTRARGKEDEKKKSKQHDDHFNLTMRLFFLNMMKHSHLHRLNDNQEENDEDRRDSIDHRKEAHRINVKPHSYDPRQKDADSTEHAESNRAHSVDPWMKEDDEICDELKDLNEGPDENDVFSSSLNVNRFSLDCDKALPHAKPKLHHSLNVSSVTSIPEESRMHVRETDEPWKRSKRAFEKIFSGLL